MKSIQNFKNSMCVWMRRLDMNLTFFVYDLYFVFMLRMLVFFGKISSEII